MRLLLRKPSKNPVDMHIIMVTSELCRFNLRIRGWETQERLSETEGGQCKDAA